MKQFLLSIFLCSIFLCFPAAILAIQLELHGTMDHRFQMYTNQNAWFVSEQKGRVSDKKLEDTFGEIKYRFWFEGRTDDENVKAVYAIEVGGVRFGEVDKGGGYSGDGVNVETRWGYIDFRLPGLDRYNFDTRAKIGLQPVNINPWLWNETAMGILFDGTHKVFDYQLGWIRGYEVNVIRDVDEGIRDEDAFYGRLNYNLGEGNKVGFFILYQTSDSDTKPEEKEGKEITSQLWEVKYFENKADLDLVTLGLDGNYTFGPFFTNWDLMYQTGNIKNANFVDGFVNVIGDDYRFGGRSGNFDVSAYFLHFDLGYNFGDAKLTYRFWYTSGDGNPDDDKFKGFLATDIDIKDSIVIFEGGYTDDDYFSERHYIMDKGFIMNRLSLDYQATKKLKTGLAGMYMMTAKDVEYTNNGNKYKSKDIGFEIDGYVEYEIYKGLTIALNAGYLFAGDAIDMFEEDHDGDSDKDIFRTTMHMIYKF